MHFPLGTTRRLNGGSRMRETAPAVPSSSQLGLTIRRLPNEWSPRQPDPASLSFSLARALSLLSLQKLAGVQKEKRNELTIKAFAAVITERLL